MSVTKEFNSLFSVKSLREIYFTKIQQSSTVGIDRISRRSFENNNFKESINVINRKVLNGTYRFAYYKEKLISKGRDSYPRVVSIPTIRDKIALKALSEFLNSIYSSLVNDEIVQTIIDKVKKAIQSKGFDYYIKIDIKNFYPSIDHDILLKTLNKKLHKKEIIALISRAIKQKTVSNPQDMRTEQGKGVPQGLSISNILANIYMINFDQKHGNQPNYQYFRYVDDILILCIQNDVDEILNEIKADIKDLKLELNIEKTQPGIITDEFPYLGYLNTSRGFSVRKKSINMLKDSLIKTFTQFKYSGNRINEKILEWRLNLRITGCKFENQKYGWLFFFSQIDDLELLFHLDWFVERMLTRFKINPQKVRIKKFVRTYHEIINNLSHTKYIPDFSELENDEKRKILKEIFLFKNIDKLKDDELELKFNRTIYKSIKDLEKDIQHIS